LSPNQASKELAELPDILPRRPDLFSLEYCLRRVPRIERIGRDFPRQPVQRDPEIGPLEMPVEGEEHVHRRDVAVNRAAPMKIADRGHHAAKLAAALGLRPAESASREYRRHALRAELEHGTEHRRFPTLLPDERVQHLDGARMLLEDFAEVRLAVPAGGIPRGLDADRVGARLPPLEPASPVGHF
jgi:hypothetical protein